MSTYPPQPGQTQPYYYQPPPANPLGIAGFVVSLSGMIVCLGLVCPIGLLLSLVALSKPPRGFAIAGTIIGLFGSIMGALTILIISGAISSGFLLSSFFGQTMTEMTIDIASYDIDNHFSNHNDTLPDEPTGNALIAGHIDEWNNNLKYQPTQGSTTDYAITSAGPDGIFGSNDDITQYYSAYNWQATQPDFEEELSEEEIAAAFDLAAKTIVDAFEVGSPLPTAPMVFERTGTLVDAWMTPLIYHPTDSPPIYHLKSAGPDQMWGTNDDLTRSFYFAPTGQADGPL